MPQHYWDWMTQNNTKFNRQDFLLSGSPLNNWDYADNLGNATLIGNAQVTNDDVFIYPHQLDITQNLLDVEHIIAYHEQFLLDKYTTKYDYYKGRHQSIITRSGVPLGRPDDRLINNFPKQLVDTFNGYAFGKSPDVTYDDPTKQKDDNQDNDPMNDDIQRWLNITNFEETTDELAKEASIYGRAYLYTYEAEGQLWYSVCSPIDTIVVYDDTIRHNPMFAIRYVDGDDGFKGTIITPEADYKFNKSSGVASLGALAIVNFAEEQQDENNNNPFSQNNQLNDERAAQVIPEDRHPQFPCLPVFELYENRSRVGIFDDSINNIDDYNQIMSMKSNDVHSYSNNYLLITGTKLDARAKDDIQNRRIINLYPKTNGFSTDDFGEKTAKLQPDAKFIQPEANDTMQEHMLDRLKNEIYRTAQVVDPEDAADGQSANAISGVVLKQRYSKMHSKASLKADVMTRVLRGVFKIKFATENIAADVMNLQFNYNFDDPHNILEEGQTAAYMNGIYPKKAIYGSTIDLLAGQSVQDALDELNEENGDAQKQVQDATNDALNNINNGHQEGGDSLANSNANEAADPTTRKPR